MCLVSLVVDIKLNTLKFKSFTASGTHIFVYGSLILLHVPLHLLALLLKGYNTGSLLLTLRISGLSLHSLLAFEIKLNRDAVAKLDKNNDSM